MTNKRYAVVWTREEEASLKKITAIIDTTTEWYGDAWSQASGAGDAATEIVANLQENYGKEAGVDFFDTLKDVYESKAFDFS